MDLFMRCSACLRYISSLGSPGPVPGAGRKLVFMPFRGRGGGKGEEEDGRGDIHPFPSSDSPDLEMTFLRSDVAPSCTATER